MATKHILNVNKTVCNTEINVLLIILYLLGVLLSGMSTLITVLDLERGGQVTEALQNKTL